MIQADQIDKAICRLAQTMSSLKMKYGMHYSHEPDFSTEFRWKNKRTRHRRFHLGETMLEVKTLFAGLGTEQDA